MPLGKAEASIGPAVLVVDSDRSELARVATILRKEGYQVIEANSFQDAVRSLRSARTRVLLTTAWLGPYNGLHLIVRCRFAQPEVVSILTHHQDDRTLRHEAASLKAAFLLKPCTPEILAHTVAASLGRA
jgi:DNA-binding response OmpR family regulator